MAAKLQSLGEASDIKLDKPIVLVGRNPECDVVLSSKKISRKHCVVAQVGQRVVVRDLGSTNGIRVNGQQLDEADLLAGDELVIGNLNFRLTMESSGPSEATHASDSRIESASNPIPLPEPDELSNHEDVVPLPPANTANPADSGERSKSNWLQVPEDVGFGDSSDEWDNSRLRPRPQQ